MRTWGSFLLKS